MKKYLFFTFLAAALVALSVNIGCKKNTDPEPTILGSPDTVFVKMNETVQIFAGNFSIRLDSVLGDSRCPANVDCVWQGLLLARFEFVKNSVSTFDTLSNLATDPIGYPDDKAGHFGFKIQLLEMNPYPLDPMPPIPQADYVAKLAVIPE